MGHEAVICKIMNQPHGELQRLLIKRRRYKKSTCWLLHVSLALNQVKIDLLAVVVLTTLKVQVGNSKYVTANGKGTVAISTNRGISSFLIC